MLKLYDNALTMTPMIKEYDISQLSSNRIHFCQRFASLMQILFEAW